MMTREEAIALFEKQLTAAQVVLDSGFGSNPGENNFLYRRRKEMAEIALTALRPVSREQVEKVWRGEWIECQTAFGEKYNKCSRCGFTPSFGYPAFCASCGSANTGEAVETVMERMEALYVERNDG